MADWRQIQARIRKAKLSADPVPALTRIYDRTRDGMAAFELATVHEAAGRTEEAVGWYTKAWQRFRRADWKQKAADAVERLGGPAPQPSADGDTVEAHHTDSTAMEAASQRSFAATEIGDEKYADSSEPQPMDDADTDAQPGQDVAGSAQPGTDAAGGARKKRSRRGRRGGRRHRAKREREAQLKPAGEAAAPVDAPPITPPVPAPPTPRMPPARPDRERGGDRERGRDRGGRDREPRRIPEPPAPEPGIGGPRVGSEFAAQARAVDPGLASRMARLEAMLRRLMASPVVPMDDIDLAPAGPGVFVLSDSDHTTYYYVEACRTLRIAITNIARARAGEGSLKKGFAEHLGISDSQVSKYVKEHCVVRWLQLDEGAHRLAHFAIAVLGPVLNEEE